MYTAEEGIRELNAQMDNTGSCELTKYDHNTEAEIVDEKRGCDGCYYYKRLSKKPLTECCCHYLLIEDEKRGCPPGEGCIRRLELDKESAAIKDRKYINDTYNLRIHWTKNLANFV